MTNDFPLEILFGDEAACRKFLPCCALRFGDGGYWSSASALASNPLETPKTLGIECIFYFCSSNYSPSTFLISPAPKPVKVRLCLGLEKPGPTGPCRSEMGALVDGRRSLESAGFDMIESKFGNHDDEKKKGEGLRRLKKSRTCIPGYKQARAQALGYLVRG